MCGSVGNRNRLNQEDKTMALFEGAGVALITPFKDNGEVNYEKLEELLEEQIAGGTDKASSSVEPQVRHPP